MIYKRKEDFEDFIGKIVKVSFPYYNVILKKRSFKVRPVLVIGVCDNTNMPDFNILPISTIKDKRKIDSKYDYMINLDTKCYIRTNKQSVVNFRDIVKLEKIKNIDFKNENKEDWENVKKLNKEYNNTLFDQ